MAKGKLRKKANTSGQIRIIGGQWRGRKLPVLNSEGLRPTTDRIKETLFNWLMFDINQSCCLDLFAGSGSLGFEALSRGAKHVVMVEKDKQVAQQLSQNLARLAHASATVINTDALRYLASTVTAFDLVLLDPPFHRELLPQVCQQLEEQGWLSNEAKIYIEHEQSAEQLHLPANWQLLKNKQAGQVTYQLYQRVSTGK